MKFHNWRILGFQTKIMILWGRLCSLSTNTYHVVIICIPIVNISHGICLLNYLICYSKYHHYNMFKASMDAEKCFDSLWHDL